MTVSVVIPTAGRPALLLRAIGSVQAQSLPVSEIIVVIDGPDPATSHLLCGLDEPRLRVTQMPCRAGAGAARNRGAASATGEWLAFLDDDDEWLPDKLARQLAAAAGRDVLVSCRSYVRTPAGTELWPRRVYDGSAAIDDYLFDRRSLFSGDTYVGTSTFLLPAALFARTRFSTDRQNEDTTLLLRIAKQAGAQIVTVPDPLVILHKGEGASLGSRYEWRDMLRWVDGMGALVTRRAYSGFCLIYLGSQAARRGDLAAFPLLLWRAFARGAPRLTHVLPFLGFWLIPFPLRRRLRHWLRPGAAC